MVVDVISVPPLLRVIVPQPSRTCARNEEEGERPHSVAPNFLRRRSRTQAKLSLEILSGMNGSEEGSVTRDVVRYIWEHLCGSRAGGPHFPANPSLASRAETALSSFLFFRTANQERSFKKPTTRSLLLVLSFCHFEDAERGLRESVVNEASARGEHCQSDFPSRGLMRETRRSDAAAAARSSSHQQVRCKLLAPRRHMHMTAHEREVRRERGVWNLITLGRRRRERQNAQF